MKPAADNHSAIRQLKSDIIDYAEQLGFSACGFSQIAVSEDYQHYRNWLDNKFHGSMEYMENSIDLRRDISTLLPESLSVVSVRMDYLSDNHKLSKVLEDSSRANISRYALGRDYHKLMRKKLVKLADFIRTKSQPIVGRAFVDSAPVLERAYAQQAGLGWIGKNSMLINKQAGSFFFLGELATNLPLAQSPEKPLPGSSVDGSAESSSYQTNDCGKCTSCMQLCPTQAIVAPYQVDARRCISYLTIEHHGSIDPSLRSLMGNRIYGCDDCQSVCPWNRYAQMAMVNDFKPRHQLDDISLLELFSWTESEFLTQLEGSPIRRIGFEKWQRNLAVALGNADFDPAIITALQEKALTSQSDLVKEHIEWAIEQQTNKTPPDNIAPLINKRIRTVNKIMG
ncbi:MAG: tRNA epoxyqueuosine(34) reductase QueG [Kangiellaceae bacterium]|jgi:epoxyqueuosine reductase|nr:tRNA epoxyqueuosine(34) reductase QueG [Kangiellaceae bacterium]